MNFPLTACAFLVAVILTLSSVGVSAQYMECIFDGEVYEDGARVGPYICIDGEWVLDE